MWFLCIIDMVIWERGGIIKHSSIYKGRLAWSLRVSEWDRHLWKVRYSQVQERKNKFPSSFRVSSPHGSTSSLKMSHRNTQWTDFWEVLTPIHLCKDIKICMYVFFVTLYFLIVFHNPCDKSGRHLLKHSLFSISVSLHVFCVCSHFCLTKCNSGV